MKFARVNHPRTVNITNIIFISISFIIILFSLLKYCVYNTFVFRVIKTYNGLILTLEDFCINMIIDATE